MALLIRMVLYAVFAGLAGAGIGSFDTSTHDYLVNADDLAVIVVSIAGYIATFLWSRVAKARGGKT